jgi:hypothetical protein
MAHKYFVPQHLPLLEDTFLDRRVTTCKVIERLDMRLRAVSSKCEVVILEVESNAWQVYKRLNTSLAQLLWVTNTRALENEWRTKRAARYDDLLACLDDARRQLSVRQVLGWDDSNADSAVAFENDLIMVRNHAKLRVVSCLPCQPCC